MKRRRSTLREARWILAAGMLAILVALPAFGLAASSEPADVSARREESLRLLSLAPSKITFDMLVPSWLPDGYTLEHIAWFSGDDEGLDIDASSVDTWYSGPGGPRIHIWQTDLRDIPVDKDPLIAGDQDERNGRTWTVARVFADSDSTGVTLLSTRWDDGTVVAVDGVLPDEVLWRIVESLEETP